MYGIHDDEYIGNIKQSNYRLHLEDANPFILEVINSHICVLGVICCRGLRCVGYKNMHMLASLS